MEHVNFIKIMEFINYCAFYSEFEVMDVLFVFSIYFSVGLYSRIQIFMRNNWYKAGLKFSMENSVNQ